MYGASTRQPVVIFKAGGKYHVHPGTARVSLAENQGEVYFRNDGERKVKVWLPVAKAPTDWIGNSETRGLSIAGVEPGVYEYAVYVEGENQFAEGNSAPRIIFD
jgi:hypothetical protein